MVADGRPFAGAVIEARAAASLGLTLDPRRWPRGGSVTADVHGNFALVIDPGTYDLIVEPPEGTGFPWVTLASREIAAGTTIVLGTIVVPAPLLPIDLDLHDQTNLPLAHAVVRAFAQPQGAAGSTPTPFVQLGSWMTDDVGHLTMFVVPP
jgi:hypothetical protein